MFRRRFPKPQLALAIVCACALTFGGSVSASEAPARRDLSTLEATVSEIESLVERAYFRRAIRVAEAAREWAGDIPRSPAAKQARARLEVLLCTAQVALGERGEARRSMGRAVYVWPLLSLDESDTSPRVVELFEEVRGKGAAGRSAR